MPNYRKLLGIGITALLFPVIVFAQFQQNQVTQSPYGGILYSTSTSALGKIGQLKGSAFGNVIYWDGSKWTTTSTSSLGIIGGVSSVFTRTGAVTAQSGDYTTAQVTESGNLYYTPARIIALIDASTTIPKTYTANTFSPTQTFTLSPIFSSLTGLLKGNGASAITTAVNGTDYTLNTARTCSAGDFISAVTAAGVFTCTTPATGTSYTGTYPIVITGSVISTPLSTTTLRQTYGTAQGGDLSIATSSDTNLLLNVTNSTGAFTFTPAWTGTLADARITSASTWNAKVGTITVASSNGFAGSSSGGTTPALTLTTTVTGVVKGNGTTLSAASNGTDYSLITAKTCTVGDFVSAVTAAGVFTCTTPSSTGGIIALGSGYATTTGTTITHSTSTLSFNGLTFGQAITVPNSSTLLFTPTVTGTLNNAGLTNSSITVNSTSIALGASGTITAASSSILGDNNTFTGQDRFSFASTTLASLTNFYSGLTGVLIGNGANSLVTAGSTQTCVNQFVRALSASYIATCSSVSLTADVAGTLPVGNGGTGTATSFTQGSVIFAGASGIYSQDNSGFFYNATAHELGIGTTTPEKLLMVEGNQSGGVARIQRDFAAAIGNIVGTYDVALSETSGIVDVAGPAQTFSIRNNGGTVNTIGDINAFRNGADNTGNIQLRSYGAGVAGKQVFVVDGSNGDVAMGTSTPSNSATQCGNFTFCNVFISGGTAGFDEAQIKNIASTSAGQVRTFFNARDVDGIPADERGEIGTETNNNFTFFSNNIARMTLTKAGGLNIGPTYFNGATFPNTSGGLIVEGNTGIGTTTPWGMLSVQSPSGFNFVNPVFTIATSTASSGQLLSVFATSSVFSYNALTSAVLNDSGVRVAIGTNQLYGSSGVLLDQVTLNGRLNTEDWSYNECNGVTLINSGTVLSDISNACGPWGFQEDTNAYLAQNTASGASGVLAIGDSSNSGLNGKSAASGGGLFFPPGNSGSGLGIFPLGTTTPVMEVSAAIKFPQNATSSYYHIGFSNTDPTGISFDIEPTIGCYFVASSTLANWQAQCRTSYANTTTVDTGFASSTTLSGQGAFYRFRIQADKNKADFFMSSSTAPFRLVASINTNISATTAFTAGVYVSNILAGNEEAINIGVIKLWWQHPLGY